MKILLENEKIISYAIVGGFEGGIEIDDSIVPSNFLSEFDSGKFLYANGEIKENPDYAPPVSIDQVEKNRADITYLAMMLDIDLNEGDDEDE